ncbi:hypothetical protein A4G27_22470 [Mycobacterium kansasii]|nr:hypothetical protein A4G27_22470 [Mycobacterium kansasii]
MSRSVVRLEIGEPICPPMEFDPRLLPGYLLDDGAVAEAFVFRERPGADPPGSRPVCCHAG